MVSSFTESRCAESAVAATAAAAAPTSSWPRLRCWLRGAAARSGETRAGVAALTSPSFSCFSKTAMRGSRSAVHLRRHLGLILRIAERQRNEALYNAEELSKAFQHYKEKVAEKLEKAIVLRIKLAIKEAEIQKLQANLTANQLSQSLISRNDNKENGKLHSLETEPVKLGTSQVESIKGQDQHTVSKQYERERQKLASGIEELRTKLMQIEAENSDLKVNMAHRTSQFQLIQEELLEKASNSSKLESEASCPAWLLRTCIYTAQRPGVAGGDDKEMFSTFNSEKQLEEKIVAYSSIAAKNAELEQELMEKNEKIRSLETNINTEHEKICLAFEKAKKIHLEQHKEMEKQIERLESQLEKKDQQFKEQEKTMSMLQQDIICKQHHLESLDRLLTESKREMEKENMKKDEALKALQNQVSEETIKVRQLDSALEICKEELALHLNQLEGNKEKFEKQLKKKSEEKELKIKNHSLQETSEQNVILQHTLQQQQQMLQQETIRNGELEDIQTKLEKQVSKLEQELQKQRENSTEKLRKMEEKCDAATHEADLKRQKVIELTGTARHTGTGLLHATWSRRTSRPQHVEQLPGPASTVQWPSCAQASAGPDYLSLSGPGRWQLPSEACLHLGPTLGGWAANI
ncbi:hypothetical protein QTO34_018341 [Cnephaeus nilssonii]|uniref:Uncharacterized protein n=1 Tax=Cnephaeus nilssonii TaxID=3371016 RepID=A0AA40HYN1_CNENI|nr:hypothetical protein QTO34_018341 [Eptesicus nilssonii]